jgi:hypothetical protein
MNTVGRLESQHREVEKLFFRIAHATDSETRTRLFGELTRHLVAYAAVEDETLSVGVPTKHRKDELIRSSSGAPVKPGSASDPRPA